MSLEFEKFTREYNEKEAAKARQAEAYQAAQQTARQRKLHVRRDLILKSSPEFAQRHVYKGNDSANEITQKCVNAWLEFRGNWSPTADVSEEVLKQFMNANLQADITKSSTWVAAVSFIESKLRECEPVMEQTRKSVTRKQGVTYKEGATRVDGTIEYEEVIPQAEPEPTPVPVPEPKNPYIWGTKAFARFEKQKRQRALHNQVLNKRAERERLLGREPAAQSGYVSSDDDRAAALNDTTEEVASIVSNIIDRAAITVHDGIELPDEAKQVLIKKCIPYANRYGIGAITPDRVRQFALSEWGTDQVDATEQEKAEFELRTNDSESAAAYKRRIQRVRQGQGAA